ncbi:Peptidase M13 N domain containing protein, partial [Asbolus verrucosus]
MKQGFNQSLVRFYFDYIVKVAIALGADEERARIEMKDVVDLNIAIARITLSSDERRNLLKGHSITIKKLEETYSYVPWLEYINIFLQPVSKVVTYADNITVIYPPYFKKLEYVMKNTSKRTLINFIHWQVIKHLLTYLNSNIRSLETEFKKMLTGVSEREPRWKEISIATGALYVQHFFKKEAKQAVIGLIDEIKEQFVETLKTVDWMDYETRQQALKKAEAIRVHAAYPEDLLNIRIIDELYENLTVDPTKYLESIQNIYRFNLNMYYDKIGKPKNYKDWRRFAAATGFQLASFKTAFSTIADLTI